MGNKNRDDVPVSMAGMEVLIFHRDNFSLVLWGVLSFFPCFFFYPSVFILQLLVVVNLCPFYPSPQLPTLKRLKVKNLAVKGNCFVLH